MANLLRITNKIEPLGVWDSIPSDSVNSIVINFDFSDEWQDDLICVAQFTQGENSYNQIIENNECILPLELVTGDVVLSVFATRLDGTAFRETSIPFCFEIFNSGFSSTADTPIPPTPDLYEQLIEKFSKNVVNSLNGKTGAVEIVPDSGIDIETTEDGKIKIKSTVSIEIDTEMSDTSENPVQNKVVKQYVDTNARTNKKVKFVLADLGDACFCGFVKSDAHILFMAQFDLSKLSVTIPQGYDYVMNGVEIEGEDFAISTLDNYVKSFDAFVSDMGEGWLIENEVYIYVHEYNFGSEANAQAAQETLSSDLPITGFSINLEYYERITAGLK